MKRVVVIGGGAAGMFAALAAAEKGHQVSLFEKNEKLGKKLFITGKGRCNLTNASDMDTLFSNIISNPKFLYSALYTFDNFRVIDFFETHGVKTKIERGNRVFPVSDHSSDNKIRGVLLENGKEISADAVIVTTGGISYPNTGSTGDGYLFARECGHKVTELFPALVPLTAKESYVTDMQGLSLKNIKISIRKGKKILFEEFGELLFTHFGVSGPLILSASSYIGKVLKKQELDMRIDVKPALSVEQLDKRLLRDFKENHKKQFKNSLNGLLPTKMIPAFLSLTGIDTEKIVNEITKEERKRLLDLLKAFPITLTGTRDFDEAIITSGGVSVKEINPSTMESKLVSGLYFAGEVLDLDAKTGGYNLQIAWSTGFLAGNSIE